MFVLFWWVYSSLFSFRFLAQRNHLTVGFPWALYRTCVGQHCRPGIVALFGGTRDQSDTFLARSLVSAFALDLNNGTSKHQTVQRSPRCLALLLHSLLHEDQHLQAIWLSVGQHTVQVLLNQSLLPKLSLQMCSLTTVLSLSGSCGHRRYEYTFELHRS